MEGKVVCFGILIGEQSIRKLFGNQLKSTSQGESWILFFCHPQLNWYAIWYGKLKKKKEKEIIFYLSIISKLVK